jgi:hypothetical protein
MYSNWYVLYVFVDWVLAGSGWKQLHLDPTSSQSTKTYNTYQLMYIYSAYLLMLGNKYARSMQRLIDEINQG